MKPEGRKRTNQPQVLIKGKIGTVRIREREGGKGSGWDQTVRLKVPHCRRGPVLTDASVAGSRWTTLGRRVWPSGGGARGTGWLTWAKDVQG